MSKRHMACELQSLIFCVSGVAWVMSYSVMELLACWEGSFCKQINVLGQKHNIFFLNLNSKSNYLTFNATIISVIIYI